MAIPVESRRDNCVCYPNRKKTKDWQADWIGVVTMEDSQKYWVFLYERTNDNGDRYYCVKLKAKEGE